MNLMGHTSNLSPLLAFRPILSAHLYINHILQQTLKWVLKTDSNVNIEIHVDFFLSVSFFSPPLLGFKFDRI